MFDSLNDYELISMALEENEEAINLLYKKYYPLFQKKACSYLKFFQNKGIELDDLVQECIIVFEEAIRGFNSFNDVCFYTFINTCLDNHLKSEVTKVNRLKNKPLNEAIPLEEDEESSLIDCLESNFNLPELELESSEVVNNLVSGILKVLTDFEECVFILKVQGFSFGEIAQVLDKNEKSIYNTIQRIKEKIRPIINNNVNFG